MSRLSYGISSANDGSMSKAVDDEQRRANQELFLQSLGSSLEQAILVKLDYQSDDFCRYYTVDSSMAGSGITRPSSLTADALFTTEQDIALLLPVADCIAALLYDSSKGVIGLAHLGRHNLEQQGGKYVIEYMAKQFHSTPNDVCVWLSPAAGRLNYPLYTFDNRSLHDVALEQLQSAGVKRANIQVDSRDTTTDESFFSHSEFLKGNRTTDGRQAVACVLRP